MPSLKRNKDGVPAITISGVQDINGAQAQMDVPAVFGLALPYPVSSAGADATPVTATSGNVANAVATATIPAVAGKTAYISGFTISGAGATAAAIVNPTVTGVISGTKTYTYGAVAGVAAMNAPLDVQFCPPIPASAVNQAIAVACPALGAGNTNNTVNAYGFYL
jgi:hypothetical protein